MIASSFVGQDLKNNIYFFISTCFHHLLFSPLGKRRQLCILSCLILVC